MRCYLDELSDFGAYNFDEGKWFCWWYEIGRDFYTTYSSFKVWESDYYLYRRK